ncbi:MAG: hypothetical protein ACR2QJ_09935 [Geminicoccaceae bacterium]
MSRVRALCAVCFILSAPIASAQVIECPGTLPAAHLEKEQVAEVAGRLLGRFSATLGLHGLEAFNESAALETYQQHPEQLLTKLTYLTLQCQMVLLDSTMAADDRLRAVRRVFLEYVLQPADPSAETLADYVNDVATNGTTPGKETEIGRIEAALAKSERAQWRETWFHTPPRANAQPPGQRSVIVASPRYEDDGWKTLRSLQKKWPDIHFELDNPYDLNDPHFAVVIGRGLDQDTANQLLKKIRTRGLPTDSYVWQPPDNSEDNNS